MKKDGSKKREKMTQETKEFFIQSCITCVITTALAAAAIWVMWQEAVKVDERNAAAAQSANMAVSESVISENEIDDVSQNDIAE